MIGTRIKIIFGFFIVITMICVIGRTGFYLVHHALIESGGEASFLPMLLHGLRLDVAVAGYLCLLPCLLAVVNTWIKGSESRTYISGYAFIKKHIVRSAYLKIRSL